MFILDIMNNCAFCIPTTTNKRDWKSADETYLFNILFKDLQFHTPTNCDITCYVGYDEDDKVWSSVDQRMFCDAVYCKFKIKWIPFGKEVKGKPTWIWNGLAKKAIDDGFDYIKILGDDIRLPRDTAWLSCFINKLKKNQNIGWVAGFSNNDEIPTQFLVHKTHYEIFDFIYPPQIHAWFCDNFLANIYPKKYSLWLKSYPLFNVGGDPRYNPKDDARLCEMLLRRYKPTLYRFLNHMDQ
tara:strand:- start:17327 stop:18046 length:720 start_codon:yes stop_codon:yes gene_type:complete